MAGAVAFAKAKLSAEHLKGFLTTSWQRCLPEYKAENLAAIDQLADAMAANG